MLGYKETTRAILYLLMKGNYFNDLSLSFIFDILLSGFKFTVFAYSLYLLLSLPIVSSNYLECHEYI